MSPLLVPSRPITLLDDHTTGHLTILLSHVHVVDLSLQDARERISFVQRRTRMWLVNYKPQVFQKYKWICKNISRYRMTKNLESLRAILLFFANYRWKKLVAQHQNGPWLANSRFKLDGFLPVVRFRNSGLHQKIFIGRWTEDCSIGCLERTYQ